jgi:phosphoribosylglycinamide formyltransferase 1
LWQLLSGVDLIDFTTSLHIEQCRYYNVNVMDINLGFLASHNGSNMQAVIAACKAGVLKARPGAVISNNGDSGALLRAKQEGIPCYHLSSKTHPVPEKLDAAILNALVSNQVDLVIMAGYMRKLGAQTLQYYKGRVINIHPALLPKLGGEGMYGIRVHQAVLEAGEKETGVTIHLADEAYDRGAIIAQSPVPVLPGDTAEILANRVLEREHSFLVETIGKIITREISLLKTNN